VRLQKAEFLLHGSCGYRACDSGSGNGLRALHASPFSDPGSLFVTMNGMGVTQVRIKRVYEKPGPDDGFRVLVDRLWPRGIRKEDLPYDLWAKEIAPSPGLRSWFHRNEAERWGEFSRRYRLELEGSDSAGPFLEEIGKHRVVTLLYASKNAAENHALILKNFIEKGK
jgi:uncharacterized protein YeaO (DUF488 family)